MTVTDPELDETRVGVPAGMSVLDYVQSRHQELLDAEEREPLTLEIPEWHGALAVRFAYPEEGATPIIRAGIRMRDLKPEKALDAALDILIGAVYDVVGKRPEDEHWQPLNPGAPTRFGPQLAQMLGITLDGVKRPARHVARHVWSPRAQVTGRFVGDVALINQAGDVSEWVSGIDAKVREELEGE